MKIKELHLWNKINQSIFNYIDLIYLFFCNINRYYLLNCHSNFRYQLGLIFRNDFPSSE